jgi:hypothetical protein
MGLFVSVLTHYSRHTLQVRAQSDTGSIIGRRPIATSDGAAPHSTGSMLHKRKKKGWLELRSFRGNFRRLWAVLRNDMLVLAKTESVRSRLSF